MVRSGNVDERIVEMQFENQQFEKNANESIGTLDKLKKALNLESAAKGFESIEAASKGIDLSGLQQGVAAIGEKFSMMGIIGITAMQRISNAAIDMGMNLGKTLLGLNGVSEGFGRYAEKSGHVKTIMTATGESIEHVSEVLDDVAWFTDETSYEFTNMVNTIGKFTSAGVKLDVAKESVEGIALWAAESGQNARTASRAMFQLAQAYGRGTILLQDWMSVEQANMSTAKIQNELIKEGGEVAEAAIAKYGGFRDSLRSGWLTTDIFNKVMQKYSEGVTKANYANGEFTKGVTEMSVAAFKNAQEARTYKDAIDAVKESIATGWSNTFELVLGNAEEAAVVWTDLANTLIGVADKFTSFRNDILQVWNDIGGRDKLVEGAYDMLSGVGRIGNYLSKSFGGAMGFGKSLEELKNQEWATGYEARQLFGELDDLYEQMDRMKIAGDSAERLEEWQAKIDEIIGSLNAIDRAHTLDSITEKFQNFASKFKEAMHFEDTISRNVQRINELKKAMASLGSGLDTSSRRAVIQETINELVDSNATLAQFGLVATRVSEVWKGFLSVLKVGKEIFTGIKDGLTPIARVLSNLFLPLTNVAGAIGTLVKAFNDALVSSGVISKSFTTIGNTIANFLEPIVETLGIEFDKLADKIRGWASDIENGISPLPGIFGSVKNAVAGFFDAINTKFPSFSEGMTFFEKVRKVFGDFLKFIEPITSKIGAEIKRVFEDIKTAFANLSFQDILTGVGTGTLFAFFKQLTDLINKLKGMLGKGKEAAGGGGIKEFFNNIKEGITGITDAVKDAANVSTLLEVAGAILLISLAMARLSAIPQQELANAFSAITAVLIEIFGFLYLFDKSFKQADLDRLKKMGNMILKLSASMYVIGKALSTMAEIPEEGLKRSVIALGAVLLEFVAFAKLTGKVEGFKSDGMIKMALSLVIIASAVKKLGDLEPEQLVKGVVAMGAILLEIAGFQALLNKIGSKGGLAGIGAGMILVAASMLIFGKAIKSLGSIDVDTLNQGLGTMAGMLAALAVVMKIIKGLNALGVAAAFVVMSLAIGNLALAIGLLGQFKWQTLAKGVLAIVAAIGSIGVVLSLMSDFTNGGHGLIAAAGAILIVAAALNLLVIPLAVLGQMSLGQVIVGLVALAGALAIMGIAAAALKHTGLVVTMLELAGAMALFGIGMTAIGVGLTLISTSLVAAVGSIMASLSMIVLGIGTFIASLVTALAEAAGSIAIGIGILGGAILSGLTMLVDPAVKLVTQLIISLAHAVADAAPELADAAIDLIIGLEEAVDGRIDDMIDAGMNLAIGFINGIADGIVNNSDRIYDAIENIGRAISFFALETLQRLTENIPIIGDDISAAIEGMQAKVKEGMKTDESEEVGKKLPSSMAKGITEGEDEVTEAASGLGRNAINSLSESATGATEAGGLFKTYFNQGFTSSGEGVSFGDTVIDNLKGSVEARSGDISGVGTFIKSNIFAPSEGSEEDPLALGTNGVFDGIMTLFDQRTPEVTKVGEDIDTNLVGGMNTKKSDVTGKAQEVADGAEKPVEELPDKFNTHGVDTMNGLISGLESLRESAVAKVRQISDEMQSAFTFSMEIGSPSKVFYRYGRYIDQGLINGLDSGAGGAVDSVMSIADAMSDAMGSEAESGNLSPTIRPVIDLTNVNGKVATIDSMLSAQRSAAIAASMDINSQVTQFDQLVDVTNRILGSIQNGSDLYLDDNILAGRINRRLGVL